MADPDSWQPSEAESPYGWWLQPPSSLEACIVQLQALTERITLLEHEIAQMKARQHLSQLRKIEYKIGRLYVKDLSGTLSIGIASFGDQEELADLSDLPIRWNGQEMSTFDEDDEWHAEESSDSQL